MCQKSAVETMSRNSVLGRFSATRGACYAVDSQQWSWATHDKAKVVTLLGHAAGGRAAQYEAKVSLQLPC